MHTGPPGGSEAGPPIEPLEKGHSPSKVRISAEELALIVAFRQALDKKERVNWEIYRGLKGPPGVGGHIGLGQVGGEGYPAMLSDGAF